MLQHVSVHVAFIILIIFNISAILYIWVHYLDFARYSYQILTKLQVYQQSFNKSSNT